MRDHTTASWTTRWWRRTSNLTLGVTPPIFPPADTRFKSFVDPARPKFNDFDTLQYGQGYQLYCKNSNGVTLPLKGKLPTQPTSTTLLPGWHLLPALSLEPRALSWLVSGIDATQFLRYDTPSSSLTTVTEAKPGEAYFVNVRTASTWMPPLPRDPTTQFVYDGDGGKVKQITASGTTILLGEVFEKDPTGKTTKYLFAGSERIAAKDSSGALRYYHGNHLGSSNVVTDATGAIVELAEYTPYGSLATHTGTANVAHKFTGQRQDSGTGLVLFPGRVYDPSLGRFLQADPFVQDPADPQMLNRYSYVRNNPVNFVDPSGYKWSWKKFFKIVAIVAAVIAVAAVAVVVASALGAAPALSAVLGEGVVSHAGAIAAVSGAVAAGSALASASISESSSPRGPPSPSPAAAPAGSGHAASFLSPVRYTEAEIGLDESSAASISKGDESDPANDLIVTNPRVRRAMERAWRDSRAYDPKRRHEEGGWIVQGGRGSLSVQRWPSGARAHIQPTPKPDNAVAHFHTHPNWGTGGDGIEGPSPADVQVTMLYGKPGFIVDKNSIYRIGNVGGPNGKKGNVVVWRDQ